MKLRARFPGAAESNNPHFHLKLVETIAVEKPRSARLSFALSSTMDSVSEVEAAADKLATEAGLEEDERFHVTMAVREAAVNAVLHGNDYDPPSRSQPVLRTPASRWCLPSPMKAEG